MVNEDKFINTKKVDLEKIIESTLMGVLVVMYESKIIHRVNMGKVIKIFGLDDDDLDEIWIDFNDPEFIEGYKKFKINQALNSKYILSNHNMEDSFKNKEDLYFDPKRILH